MSLKSASTRYVKRAIANIVIPDVDLSSYIQGTGITSIVKLTQAEYDALTPVETTLYIIVEE